MTQPAEGERARAREIVRGCMHGRRPLYDELREFACVDCIAAALRALNLSAIEGAPAAGEREARYAHPAEAVRAFHEALGVALSDSWWSPSRRALRQRLIVEEFEEWREAETADDPHATLDALVDMTYVIVGAALEYGWDFAGAFAAVHAANMAKLGTDGKPNIREDGKVLKPAGWQAADLTPYLAGTVVAPASPRSAAPEDKR